MADRIVASLLLLVAVAYTVIAFTAIRAPFQYDPLGPESWPQLIGMVSIACLAYILVRPDVASFQVTRRTGIRILALIGMLFAYGWAFQPLGFIFSTWLFCVALSLMLGAKPVSAVVFGGIAGIAGYFVCTVLLDLNLPAGLLARFL